MQLLIQLVFAVGHCHRFGIVNAVMFGENSKQRTDLQPPLVGRQTMFEVSFTGQLL